MENYGNIKIIIVRPRLETDLRSEISFQKSGLRCRDKKIIYAVNVQQLMSKITAYIINRELNVEELLGEK